MTTCDHWIGQIGSQYPVDILLSNYAGLCEQKADHAIKYNRRAEESGGYLEPHKGIKPLDYIDRRKGLSTLFNYCPHCGVKIDWKQLRKELK